MIRLGSRPGETMLVGRTVTDTTRGRVDVGQVRRRPELGEATTSPFLNRSRSFDDVQSDRRSSEVMQTLVGCNIAAMPRETPSAFKSAALVGVGARRFDSRIPFVFSRVVCLPRITHHQLVS